MEKKEYDKTRYNAQKEKYLKQARKWAKKNPQKLIEIRKKWYSKNKDYFRNAALKSKYGITLEEYNKMCISQNNKCAICGKSETFIDYKTKKNRILVVDHNHKTGQIRGLLCNRCNIIIGRIEENQKILFLINDYLNKWKE